MPEREKNGHDEELRVLLVAPTLPILGGQTVQAQRLYARLQMLPGIHVGMQAINPTFLPRLQQIKYARTLVTTLKYVIDLYRRVPEYDILHIFSASYSSFVLSPTPALLMSMLYRKRTILNYRSGEAADHLTRWRSAVRTIRMFDRIIVPSNYLVDVFRQFGLSATPIFNFVDTEIFPFRGRSPIKPVFLSNRNFESHYNVDCVLRAFQIIQRSHRDSRLIVVGDGPLRETLHTFAEALELDNVEFRGRVEPGRMASHYGEADIYLNAPSIDNMPGSILEAFASGLPVVSTNAGGIPYIVENERTGLLVEVDDHEGLAKAALRLLDDGELATRITEAARQEVERYSWENVKDQWLNVYRELAHQAKSRKVR